MEVSLGKRLGKKLLVAIGKKLLLVASPGMKSLSKKLLSVRSSW